MTKLRELSLTNGGNDGKESLTTPFSRTSLQVYQHLTISLR